MTRDRLLTAIPVAAAGLLAVALIGVALVTARTLRERDAAVRDGMLGRAGHELEARLRESGPEGASAAIEAFVRESGSVLAGAAVAGPAGISAKGGETEGAPAEMPAMLGRDWNPASGTGQGRGPMGRGPMMGRGRMGSPFILRLYPAPGAGHETRLAGALVLGAAVAGAGLLGFSLVAARGLSERRRLEMMEAERERLDALALAGAGLAHRIRNPLAAIKGTAQLIADQPASAAGERAARIVEASRRIEELLTQLLRFARPPEPLAEPFDLVALARETAERAGGLRLEQGEAVMAVGDRGHALEIVEELIANARAHDASGEISLAVRREADRTLLEVRDRGPGLAVDPEDAFDPYVTTRPGGTGLGLPLVRALARASGGDVTLAAREGGGCVARLSLPEGGR
jgi:two-component system sensor histidine kinase HydH